jgi:hypothetical protein
MSSATCQRAAFRETREICGLRDPTDATDATDATDPTKISVGSNGHSSGIEADK